MMGEWEEISKRYGNTAAREVGECESAECESGRKYKEIFPREQGALAVSNATCRLSNKKIENQP